MVKPFCRSILTALVLITAIQGLSKPFVKGELRTLNFETLSMQGEQYILSASVRFDKSLYQEKEEWLVFNEEKAVIARFRPISTSRLKRSIIAFGQLASSTANLTVGFKVGYFKEPIAQPNLPNRVFRYQERTHVKKNIKDQSDMVFIPKGEFIYGNSSTARVGFAEYTSKLRPVRTRYEKDKYKLSVLPLRMHAFYIDKYEVTHSQFSKFLNETGLNPPPEFNYNQNPNMPIDHTSYKLAHAYCKWAGKRLPTELEWEKAARGPGLNKQMQENEVYSYSHYDARDYPIEGPFDKDKCNTVESGRMGAIEVQELTDASFYGVMGMCGNVAEWTSSWFMPYRGNSATSKELASRLGMRTQHYKLYGKRFKVIRGGSYLHGKARAKAYARMIGGSPSLSSDYKAGFCCAKSK